MLDRYASKVKINLKKVKGMLALIEKMVEEDRYCIDVAQQVNAAMGMLRQTNNHILASHLNTCGGHKLNSKNEQEREQFVKELIQAFAITSK